MINRTPADKTDEAEKSGDGGVSRGTWVLVPVLSLIWLAGKLWASHGQIRSSGGGTIALATAAAALPGVVQATIIAGIGLALLLGSGPTKGWLRWVMSILMGAAAGALTGVAVLATYPHLPSIGTIGGALIAAGLIGGVLAGVERIRFAVAAGLASTLAALVAITFLNSNVALSHMLHWYGAGTTAESYVHASKLVQYTEYVVVGIVAGLIAFSYLRRAGNRAFPTYLLAGALPGLVLLVAYGLTSIGGHHLLSVANGLSEADRIVNGMEASETVPNAMIVLFIGAFTALVAFGRTLKPTAAVADSSQVADDSADKSPVKSSVKRAGGTPGETPAAPAQRASDEGHASS